EVDIIKKTEKTKAKMTKTEQGMEKTVQNQRPKSKISKVESILKIQQSNRAGTENTMNAILTHLMGGKAQ
ncbi:hypothetical protein Tco_0308679, partial [Tanacetum coccineum]